MKSILNILARKPRETVFDKVVKASVDWGDSISHPVALKKPDQYEQRNQENPPRWDVPDAIKDMPWNISEVDLLAQAPDEMSYPIVVAGEEQKSAVIKKIYEGGQAVGFSGLPKTGARGPGILGKGVVDGMPSPITVAEDSVIFIQDEKTGEIYTLLGNRPEFCFAGGFSDAGEKDGDAAVREFFEEVLVGSYDLGEEANQLIEGKAWKDIDKSALCRVLEVDEKLAKQPALAEFKYQVLKAKQPEAVEEIGTFMKQRSSLAYAGFVKADPRVTDDRSVYTRAYAMTIKSDELDKLLSRHGLSLASQSDEIGKLKKVKVTSDVLLADPEDSTKPGMYASHGPILMQGLAHQIKLGNIDPNKGKAKQQIKVMTGGVEIYTHSRELKNKAPDYYQQKTSSSVAP